MWLPPSVSVWAGFQEWSWKLGGAVAMRSSTMSGSKRTRRRRRRRWLPRPSAAGGTRRPGSPCRCRAGGAATRGGWTPARPPRPPRWGGAASSAAPTSAAAGTRLRSSAAPPRRPASPARPTGAAVSVVPAGGFGDAALGHRCPPHPWRFRNSRIKNRRAPGGSACVLFRILVPFHLSVHSTPWPGPLGVPGAMADGSRPRPQQPGRRRARGPDARRPVRRSRRRDPEGTTILLERGWSPQTVLDEALVEGMRIVGIDFRDGILFVPEVLLSANAMKAGMAHPAPAAGRDRRRARRQGRDRHRQGRHPRHRQEPGGDDAGGRRVRGDRPRHQHRRRPVPRRARRAPARHPGHVGPPHHDHAVHEGRHRDAEGQGPAARSTSCSSVAHR